MRARVSFPLAIILLLGAVAPHDGSAGAAPAASAGLKYVPAAVYTQWIRVDPSQPRTIMAGGALGCGASPSGTPCSKHTDSTGQPLTCSTGFADGCLNWLARSLDRGRTWTRLEHAIGIDALLHCAESLSPVVLGGASSSAIALINNYCGSPNSTSSDLLVSPDSGLHWRLSIQGGHYGGGPQAAAISPLDASHMYAAVYAGGSPDDFSLEASIDGGQTWPVHGNLVPPGAPAGRIYLPKQVVPDPALPDAVYVNLVASGGASPDISIVSRSVDGGRNFTLVAPPAGLSPTSSFAVGTDPHLPGLLVGRSGDPTVPPSRVFLSGDQGNTWKTADCPGVLNGHCPLWTLDNTFGAGASYAFLPTGVYRFLGAGPSGSRVAISTRLPAPIARVVAVAAGAVAGDPVYLLAKPAASRMPNVLYASLDAGQHWSAVPVAPLPNQQPAAASTGALLVRQTHHSVAAPFVAAYRKLGLNITGYPLTEAYMNGDMLVQIFEHMRLELHDTRVVVSSLGSDEFDAHITLGDPALSAYRYGEGAVSPVPNTPARRYFPSSRHTISGDLLRFWQAHGGLSVLGVPLTEVVRGTNGDGSGRVYDMQYFTNARLERHPENADPRFKILLGLLGSEWLIHEGWAVSVPAGA